MYLTASKLDIAYSVGACVRYQAGPKESHLIAVKRIIKYVNGTLNYGLWYPFNTNSLIAGYSDSDWGGNLDNRKSTSGGCFFVRNCLVSWHNKKQTSISLSTAKADRIHRSWKQMYSTLLDEIDDKGL